MPKKKVADLFNDPSDPLPTKKEPKRMESYSADELLGENPGFNRRWAFYKHLEHIDKVKEMQNGKSKDSEEIQP